MAKAKWLPRSLFQGPYLSLVTTQSEMDDITKNLGVEKQLYCSEKGDATTHSFLNTSGSLVAVVGLNLERCAGKDPVDVAALLVHEAVHVWQDTRSRIVYTLNAERTGGLEAEMEAYAIQNIAANLMEAYRRLI